MQKPVSRMLRRTLRPAWLGTLRRTQPLSDVWGFDRGTPVDRYYIESFLQKHREAIQGHALEVKDNAYIERFGIGVSQTDILDIDPNNPHATIVADLATADEVASDSFDCIVLTQTLHLIYDVRAAVSQLHRMLLPGGVCLTTVPALSRVSRGAGIDGDFWRFTVAACTRLFGEVFGPEQISVEAYGNVLTAIAFLSGMAYEELSAHELEAHDLYFPVVIGVRAVKA
jgi:SAM-dependent methyltransferase